MAQSALSVTSNVNYAMWKFTLFFSKLDACLLVQLFFFNLALDHNMLSNLCLLCGAQIIECNVLKRMAKAGLIANYCNVT